jgi:selenocysteine lyase/cysteine desulfurase
MGYGDGPTLAAAERTRHQAADLLGCAVDEIAITRSTTDGMNAIAQGLSLEAGSRVLTSDQEHEGGSMCWRHLAHRPGIGVDVIPIPPGENDVGAILDRLRKAITPGTRVISISHVLASTGLRMPIAEISALARSRGLFCVVDGAQAVGGIEVKVKALGCHAYATSGHKWLMAPKGTGLLYLANETKESIQPIQFEDGRTYYSESSGVGNLPGVVGLGVALESLERTGITRVEGHNIQLRNRIHEGLATRGVGRVVSPAPGPLATPLVTFELPAGVDSRDLMKTLRDKHRIEVKLVPKRWLNAIRLSPHIFNTADEVGALLSALRRELA